ncbi:MAG: MmcQ/YjbR family DNA-binding protein [Ruminococcus sp.]|uniref:MmcQ/YjbR family DNA-binding protein n=1 Tax=Ruminococcus sp. TaxID=41978 RepID=UPI0025E2A5DB|nr:MmcQ/YjbR family DNA-binding protein [Ruminococcus sp.]MBR5683136.1 MmcQ/YjbR family DNA-binding protein [Ruminococcus sp.]
MAALKMRDRLFAFAAERFGTKPEYLWSRTPDCAVLRCSNDKWYAIVMDVDGSKLGRPELGKVDIVNVKCSPMMTGSLLAVDGIFPAYHMNKESWISVLLDGSVDIEQLKALLEMSHELSGKSGSGRRMRTEPKEWLIPAAPAMYDVEQDFRRDGTIIWKQTANYIVGDTIYIYMAAPVSAVLYKCEAIEVDIPFNYDNGSYHIRKAVKLKLLHRFSAEDMPLTAMRELGVSAVRGPRGVPNTLSCRLRKLCTEK